MVQKRRLENGMLAIVDPEFTATPDIAVQIRPSRAAGKATVLLVAVGAVILAATLARRRG